MPIYEYHCPKCDADFELMRPMSQADSPANCPKCGTQSERLVSVFASKVGFYIRAPEKPAFRKSDQQSSSS